MHGLTRLVKRIGSDIAEGRNIESYVVTLVAIVLAVIGVVDDVVPESVKFATVLAALALLVFQSTRPEETIPDLDAVLLDRQSYGPFREFIANAQELWIYGPSAVNVLRNAADIKTEVLDKGGSVRVLLQDLNSDIGMKVLYQQLDKVYDLADDIKSSERILKSMQAWAPDRVDYGYLPYSPGFSLIVVDPDGKNGRMIIELYGYQNELITERMHVVIERHQSQYWFEYWDKQYQVMWNSRRQPVPGNEVRD
ncbi:MAG: hypothetical protein K8L99_06715 [Anaerolineae bacterium]|nr:hypothetical protein [Anaerolineae bacterium]